MVMVQVADLPSALAVIFTLPAFLALTTPLEETEIGRAEEARKDRKIADKVNKVADAANALYEELRRKVTVEELMAESSFSRKTIEDAVRMSGDKIEAVDTWKE